MNNEGKKLFELLLMFELRRVFKKRWNLCFVVNEDSEKFAEIRMVRILYEVPDSIFFLKNLEN